jgi:DNA helicase-2/ATP-dependent DNA helicase PcrA
MQAEITGHGEGPMIVDGAPGTGKSAALDQRLVALAGSGLDPSRIALVTSTPLAAETHRRGLEARLSGPYEEIVVGTWEAFAERLLRRWPLEAGLDPEFEVAGPAERLAMLLVRFEELPLRNHQIRGNPAGLMRRLLTHLDAEKAMRAATPGKAAAASNREGSETGFDSGPSGAAAFGDDPLRQEEFERLVDFHDRMLSGLGCLDSNDLCRIAAGLIAGNAAVREAIAAAHPHLLVDEAEQLTPVKAGLLAALAAGSQSVVVAIDPSSGTDPEAAKRLVEQALPGADRVRLDRAWGIGADQIEVARAVLSGGGSRGSTAVTAVKASPDAAGTTPVGDWLPVAEGGCEIRFWRCETVQAEAQGVAREIELMVADGVPPDSIAVAVADPNRDGQISGAAIEDRGVPVAVSGGSALFRMPEVRDTVAWLRALCDPTDGGAVTRALTRPPIELRPVDLAQLTVIARRRKLDLVSACEAALESPRMSPESRERLAAFLKLHRAASGALDRHRPDAFVRRLIERIGFRRQGMFAAKPETAERLLSLSRLAEVATAWSRREPDGSTRDFTAFVSALADTGLEPAVGPRMPTAGKVRVVPWDGVRGGSWRRVYMLGLDRSGDSERPAVAAAITSAGEAVVLSRVEAGEGMTAGATSGAVGVGRDAATGGGRPATTPAGGTGPGRSGPQEDAFNAACTIEEVHQEELFGPAEDLHSTYRMMRDEVLEASWRAGREMIEPRLDTPNDLNRAITRYLELLKLAALAQRPGDELDAEAISAVNGLLGQVATPAQMEELERSTLDPYLLANERERGIRQDLIDSRSEPSLAAFLPRRGEDLRLSASDLDLYLTCPLKYKFARVFGIPRAPTINQRFGILIHNVLQRFHDPKTAPAGAGLDELMSMLDAGWRRGGFGESNDELQFHDRAVTAMENYWKSERASDSQPLWLERQFEFRIGPHYLRGRVDRVDRRADGSYEVIDYKTGQRIETGRHGGDIQLALYRLGAKEAWNTEIESGSYYYVLEGEKDEVEASPDDRERVERTALEVGDGILGQDFEPRPSPGVCGWCDFKLVCPAAEA